MRARDYGHASNMRAWSSLLLLLLTALPRPAAAQQENLIERPGAHPTYYVELEPHLGFGGYHGLFGGPGLRANVPVLAPGFIPRLNNSVAIGIGADVYFGAEHTHTHDGEEHTHPRDLAVPVVMQWNFWFTKEWSAFGEPGVQLSVSPHLEGRLHIAAGGRYHVNDAIALSLRLGFPVATFGVSFLL